MTLPLPGPSHAAPRHVRARRRHRTIYLGLASLSATLIPALVAARALDHDGATLQLSVLAIWFVGWAALAVVLFQFRCPQCGRYFHRGNGILSAFNSRCIHCGLPLRPANDLR